MNDESYTMQPVDCELSFSVRDNISWCTFYTNHGVLLSCNHYQLLCCEDDDESYTMQPVDCELSFSVRDNISWCTFYTTTCWLHF